MKKPEFSLSFDCPACAAQWTITASVRRDDECSRCGTVSRYTRARVLEDWSDLSCAAWRPLAAH